MVTTIFNSHTIKAQIFFKTSNDFISINDIQSIIKTPRFIVNRKVFEVKNGVKKIINHLPLNQEGVTYIEIIIISSYD